MSNKNPAAVALGSIKSDKKARAARENGKKGGKPKRTDLIVARLHWIADGIEGDGFTFENIQKLISDINSGAI